MDSKRNDDNREINNHGEIVIVNEDKKPEPKITIVEKMMVRKQLFTKLVNFQGEQISSVGGDYSNTMKTTF